MGRSCVLCKSSYSNVTNNSLFKVPGDSEKLKVWQAAIPGEIVLKTSHFICKSHFETKYVLTKYQKRDANGEIIAEVPFKQPRLDSSAIPTIFDIDTSIESLAVTSIVEYAMDCLPIEKEIQSNELPVSTALIKDMSEQSIITDVVSAETPQHNFASKPLCIEKRNSLDDQQRSGTLTPAELTVPMSESPPGFCFSNVIVKEGNTDRVGDVGNRQNCSAVIPKSWSVGELSGKSLLFSNARKLIKNGVESAVTEKCVILHADKTLSYQVYGHIVNVAAEFGRKLPEILDSTEELPNILTNFEHLNLCSGIGTVNVYYLQTGSVFSDGFERWHHKDCSLISKKKRCDDCSKLRKLQLQKEARSKKSKTLNRVFSSSNPIEKKKLDAMRRKNCVLRRKKNRAKQRIALLLQSLNEAEDKLSKISAESLEKKLSDLKVPDAQKTALQEIIEAAKTKDAKGRRYTEQWIMLCILMNIRSPAYYEFLRKNNVLPLPCTRTIRGYFSLMNMKCGFDENFSQLLKKHFERKTPLQRHGLILLDEINLRKSVAVCSRNLTYVGLTDFGNDGPQSTSIDDQASHGLVLMFQPLADTYTQPIAVFASKNPVKGEELAKLVVKAIMYLEEAGAKIHGIIADGASTNKKMSAILGVTCSIDDTKTWFSHPLDSDRKVFVFSDSPHLMKTVRNRLHNKKRLRISSTSDYIEWKYFVDLFKLDSQHVGNARACPKITQRHVSPDSTSKMRVRLATQIFSNSVADGLAFYLSQKCSELDGCEETISFCKRLNDVFDALNRKSPNEGLTPDSKDFKVLEEALKWLNRWELAVQKGDITADEFLTRETAQGLRLSLQSTMDLCCYLIQKFDFQYLLTGKVNQDNLEKFFGTIRQAAGCNDHPNCPTFLQLYKLLSMYSIIKPPKHGNCTVSDEATPQILVTLSELKSLCGQNEAKSAQYRRAIQQKLDATLEHENWDADDIIETQNVSILHLRGAASADSWDPSIQQQQQSANFGSIGRANTYTRTSSIPTSLKRHDQVLSSGTGSMVTSGTSTVPTTKQQQQQESGNHSVQSSRRREATNFFLSGSGGTSGELFVSGNCSRELSPVRWCDREVDGVYLGRSGWVQVQQRSLDENRKSNYESNPGGMTGGNGSENTGLPPSGTIPLPRRATVKLADYHCSNSEPGKCPDFTRALTLDSHRPDFLKLHHHSTQEYETPSACTSPHSIPESCSPPSITPIISPPPAFQDYAKRTSSRPSRSTTSYGKAPFLPRSNAIIDSDVISPPPSPPLPTKSNSCWNSLPSAVGRKPGSSSTPFRSRGRSRQQVATASSQGSSTCVTPVTAQQATRQQERQYRLVPAKSLEEQTSSTRRTQFAQRYLESSSSSSSSMGFRSLDSCVNRTTMPRLAENTDSSVEGYEDGDEDDNPSSSFNSNVVGNTSKTPRDSSPESNIMGSSCGQNVERVSPSGRHQSRHSRQNQQQSVNSRGSPGSNDAGKQLSFESLSSSSSSSSSTDRQGRSPTPNHFRRSNQNRQQQSSSRNTLVSPDSLQTSARVRRSRSLQLPERKSPGSSSHSQQVSREHSRESSDSQSRVVVKILNERVTSGDRGERGKRHPFANRKAQSTEDTMNAALLREVEAVTEYLYGTRSRVAARNLLAGRYEGREDSQEQRRSGPGTYDVYFISAKQPRQQHQPTTNSGTNPTSGQKQQHQQFNKRPKTLQRGATTPNTNSSSTCPDFCVSSDTKNRCNSSTCDFWPHCSQRDTIYSPNQGQNFMKLSQSYPAHRRVSADTINQVSRDRGSACSSPASLDVVDDRTETITRKQRFRSGERNHVQSKDEERLPKSALKQSRWSPLESPNGNDATGSFDKRDHHPTHWEYRNVQMDRRISPIQNKSGMGKSPSGSGAVLSPSMTTSSSSSSDIWITTSDRTVTKSPKNPKSSGASTPMEDAMQGSLKTFAEPDNDDVGSRPGSAPARREDSPSENGYLNPQQRSSSLPKSFFAHNSPGGSNNSSLGGSTARHHRPEDSRRSTPSPNCLHPDMATFYTAPASPSHAQHQPQLGQRNAVERKRTPGLTVTRAQRRVKASSTPALLDRDHESREWSGDEERVHNEEDVSGGSRRGRELGTEHPLAEATIPLVSHSRLQDSSGGSSSINVEGQSYRIAGSTTQSQQESVLQKFRKSFSLRFHKKGSKESTDGDGPTPPPPTAPILPLDDHGPNNDLSTLRLNVDDDEQPPSAPAHEQSSQHKEDLSSDQKFRFGPLVWRTSKERKKGSKAARNAKCNSGDSGIQIEMVSGGALTGGSGGGALGAGDSSESHDTDVPDETDSPPALRRRVTEKSRPQSELINQILIDKFKADLQQSRASRHNHVRRTNSDLGGQRLLQWDTRLGYGVAHNYRRMLSTPSPIKTRPPRLSPRHSSHDIVTLRSNAKGRSSRTNLRRSLSQPLGINQLSPLMRTKTAGVRYPGGNVLSEDEQDGRCGGGSGGAGNGTSDDEMMSDSESSIASLTERKKSFEQNMEEELVILAEAVWDHVAIEPEELAFRAGELIDVLDTMDKDWWWGSCRGEHGWFPAAFVRLRVSQEETVEDCLAAMASGASSNSQSRRRTSISLLSNEQVRSSVVRELVQTERDFVKVLRDVAEGYVAECRRRADMFTEDQIETIFINLEDLLEFQSEFLKDLETRIDWNSPHKSCVAECFLIHRTGFRMYSEYCNSHPMAMATLQELYRHNRYSKFFEACRLMRGLIEIPLDGYLLTPVQRICKYPLQLAELLKYTKTDHPDYHKIREALEAMRSVAILINERKRRMESLEKLAAWQLRVEGWEGEDLIEVSSQLIYQGDAIRVTSGMWTNNITLFLFDHQLVYCKKDILKRDTYVYKGRIYLDTSEVIDVPDGKDHQLGVTVRHCLKVYSCVRDKWLLFCCRTADEKRKWLSAMVEERRLVEQDRNDGLEFPAAARQLARLAATRQQRCRPPVKPRNKTYKREPSYEMQAYANQANSTNSLGRKVGTWFTFGSSKKGARLRPS